MPKSIPARQAYAETIGQDGMQLLSAIYDDGPDWLREIPSVDILRQTWVHQYFVEDAQVRLRSAKDLPPAGQRYDSPYDPQARYGNKRSTTWTGYKVHLSETCDQNSIHLITHVVTTQAHISDTDQSQPIHQALDSKASNSHFGNSTAIEWDFKLESLEHEREQLVPATEIHIAG